jgi:hypothetical protein
MGSDIRHRSGGFANAAAAFYTPLLAARLLHNRLHALLACSVKLGTLESMNAAFAPNAQVSKRLCK